jgi:thioredoxin reductase
MMAPIFKKVAADYTQTAVFVKIDTNAQPELSSRYQIRSLPTFQMFLDGKKVDQAIGGIGEAQLRQSVDKLVRQAEYENVRITFEHLQEFYKQQQDASKSEKDIQEILDKCAGKKRKIKECVGASAVTLIRKLKKKYGVRVQSEPRFQKTTTTDEEATSSEKTSKQQKQSRRKDSNGPNLHLATLEQLQEEIEKRLDEIRDKEVEAEDPNEDEHDTELYRRWNPHSSYPERVVILGGGPAGLSAALYAARAGLEPLVLAPSMGGQLQGKGVEIENYPGVHAIITTPASNTNTTTTAAAASTMTGPALVASMRKQAAHFGAVFEDDIVERVFVPSQRLAQLYSGGDSSSGGGVAPIEITTHSTGVIQTHTLIVATGAEAKWLDVPGEYELRGGGVSSCAVCDGYLFAGRNVVVVGGGDAAAEDALVLARTSRHVTLVHRRDQLRASKILADRVLSHPHISIVWNATVQEILGTSAVTTTTSSSTGDDEDEIVDMDENSNNNNNEEEEKIVRGVILKDASTGETKEIATDAVFIAIGHTPSTSFLEGVVDFQPDHPGYILLRPGSTQTSVPGIFAAGDVADPVYRQAITSAGSGAAAALDAERFLSEHGLGNEAADLEAELIADLMMMTENESDKNSASASAYNVYEEAGGRMHGMKESLTTEL